MWRDGAIRDYAPYTPTAIFVSQYLPFWGQYVRSIHSWAPDGSAFTYAAATESGDSVFIQRLSADEPEAVGPGSISQWLS